MQQAMQSQQPGVQGPAAVQQQPTATYGQPTATITHTQLHQNHQGTQGNQINASTVSHSPLHKSGPGEQQQQHKQLSAHRGDANKGSPLRIPGNPVTGTFTPDSGADGLNKLSASFSNKGTTSLNIQSHLQKPFS